MQKILVNSANIRISIDSVIFDTGDHAHVDIVVDPGISASYCFVPTIAGEYVRHIDIMEGASFTGSTVIVPHQVALKMTSNIAGDNGKSTLALLVLARDSSDITVEGVAKIDQPYRHISTRVDQTNILLGTGARVRGVPRLEIATDDVEGGHSCKIHRLGGDAAFYLESRGLSPQHAETLLLNSEILKHLTTIQDEEDRKKVCYDIHMQLLKK